MRRLSLAMAVWCAQLLAQSPTDIFQKAPPATDKALRESVRQFFQAHVDGKFRDAEKVVAEDSQDAYYNSPKKRYFSFEVVSIQYSENFTKAAVVTAVELDWYAAPVGTMRVKPPLKTLWKKENGQWRWYVIPQKDWETPFGRMKPGEEPASGPTPKWKGPDVATVLQQVKASKSEVKLISHEKSEDVVEITNGSPGDISLRVDQPSPVVGLEVSLDRSTVKSGETARLTFKFSPPNREPKATLNTTVTVSPTSQVLPFQITFAVPPEYEKYLRKKTK